MAKKIITYEQVAEYAKSLLEAGVEPTTLGIYGKFDKKGSLTTITKYLKQWLETTEAKQQQQEQLPEVANLPERIQEEFLMLLNKIWIASNQTAIKEFDTERESYKQDIQKLTSEIEDYSQHLAIKESEVDELENSIDSINKDLSELSDKHKALEKSHNSLFNEKNKLTTLIESRDQKIASLGDIINEKDKQASAQEKALVAINANFNKISDKHEKLEVAHNSLKDEKNKLNILNERQITKSEQLKQSVLDKDKELSKLAKLESENEKTGLNLVKLEASSTEKDKTIDLLKKQIAALNKQFTTLNKQLSEQMKLIKPSK